MANKFNVILEIGSEKISAVCGSNGVNNSFNIVSFDSEPYAGFLNGEFIDVFSLKLAIGELVTRLENSTHKAVDFCYVGVPSEFCLVDTKRATLNFEKPTKITSNILQEISKQAAYQCEANKDYVLINKAPIYFACEDGRHILNPQNRKATRLDGEISFLFAKKSFIKTLSGILKDVGFVSYEFLGEPLAENLYLLSPEVRETGAILIDCGYITTSVFYGVGDGIKMLKAFSLGGGNITADLSEVLKLKFSEAEKLKRNIVLSLDLSESEVYSLETFNGAKPINAKMANEIVEKRIEQIASYITKCINSFEDASLQTPVYITGGGITKLKGAKDYLSKLIARKLIVAKGSSLEYREPDSVAALSLLNFAILINEGRGV